MPAYEDDHGRWRYRFRFKGKRYSGSAPKGNNTKRVALQLEKELIEKLTSRRYAGPMPTVEKFAGEFLDYQRSHVKPLSIKFNETAIDFHTVPHIGKLKLDEVDRRQLDHLVSIWSKDAAPSTINTRMGQVLRMLSLAVEWKILPAVPRWKRLSEEAGVPRFLSEPEAAELLGASKYVRADSNDWHSMILVGLRTGLRIGELRGLQWADVTLRQLENDKGALVDTGTIHVVRTDPGDGSDPTSPKSNKTRRVPLTPDAAGILTKRLAAERKRLGKKWSPTTWVWPSTVDHRRTMSTQACQGAMERYTRHAKIEDCSWHTLRHTFASWLVMRGVPLRAVQELLGHAELKMTLRYAHLAPDFAHHAAVAALDVPLMPTGQTDRPAVLPQPSAGYAPYTPRTPLQLRERGGRRRNGGKATSEQDDSRLAHLAQDKLTEHRNRE